jgi:sterol desaturase/sphingolipid hydroxylase (fatty acid hydroxylase superfamily)
MAAFFQGVGALLFVLVVGSFLEYVVHRLMHAGIVLGKKHAEHHAEGIGQGWLGELKDYLLPAAPIAPLGFLVSLPIGVGLCLGALVYGAAAAYAHQVQHDRPELVFWMPRPVHALHHEHRMWHHNFGILVDVWDRVFGTYRPAESARAPARGRGTLRELADIKWR